MPPLTRKFSSVFKKKSGQSDGAAQAFTTPTIIEEDYNLQLALQRSLNQQRAPVQNDQIEQLKAQLHFEKQQRVNQTRKLAQENSELRAIVASLQDQERAASSSQKRVADLEQQLTTTRQSIGDLTTSANRLQTEKDALNEEILRLEGANSTLHATITALEERLSVAERLYGGTETDRERVSSELLKENRNLTAKLKEHQASFERYHADVVSQWAQVQNQKAGLEAQFNSEKKARADSEASLNLLQARLNSISDEVESLKRSQTHFNSLLGPGTSPRIILMLMVLRGKYIPSSVTEGSARFRQTGAVQHLSAQCLDISLAASEVGNFVESLCRGPETSRFYHSLSLKPCALCEVPKFVPSSTGVATSQRINEFPGGFSQTPCCSSPICSACLPGAIANGVRYDWWHNLNSQPWIKCPIQSCGNMLSVRNIGEFENLLRRVGYSDCASLVQMFERATILRSALQELKSKPSAEALTVTSNLHKHLMQRNRMYDFFDSRFNSTIPDEYGRMPPFNPGIILQADIDESDLQIPIFTKFFRRRTTPRECSICAEVLYDIDCGTDDEWIKACEGFQGPWMWNVLLFPTKWSLADCDHDLDACKECISTHITTQLDANGINGCDRLACPLCNRVLHHNEIRVYATKETFQKYDKLRLRKLLSAEPGFRWCLNPDCDSGQLYDDTEYLDPRIVCEECEFESCFTHLVRWHEGLSCDQFESQREHGDPEYAQTQQWIRQNSKPCPGCNANVEKDAGCFHMTCRVCRHEFCWECLADWDLIHSDDGEYNASAHNEGCWFRTGNLEPTQISGNDLQAALRRRRNS